MDGFRDVVGSCGFTDLGFIGLPYTWDNRQQGAYNIKVRLDRGFANGGLLDVFQNIKVWHVQTTESDHCCLLIELHEHHGRSDNGRKGFMCENMWRRDESYLPLVRQAWGDGETVSDMNQLQARMTRVRDSMRDWNYNVFGSVDDL
jgi:hypothetical protein